MQRTSFFSYRGLSLPEILLVAALISVLVLTATPPISAWLERLRLTATTQQVVTLLRQAQQLSAARQAAIGVYFIPGENWCLALSEDEGCDCRSVRRCQIAQQQVRLQSAAPSFTLTSNRYSLATPLVFNPFSGSSNSAAGTIRVSGTQAAARIVISPLGRIRACTERGALNGMPAC